MDELMSKLNFFVAENRWVVWPIIGALMMMFTGIKSLGGVQKLKEGNHPIQAVIGMVVIGAIGGLIIAYVTKTIFH